MSAVDRRTRVFSVSRVVPLALVREPRVWRQHVVQLQNQVQLKAMSEGWEPIGYPIAHVRQTEQFRVDPPRPRWWQWRARRRPVERVATVVLTVTLLTEQTDG